ncbi:cytochrome c maturation protein CcmE [Thiothrix fructosivorans]|uniref:Cytochrome c-type biogenesis protein CcmE n=1 Tax=Thiothrix fructosivorans TaxID=111770 RepID=A0A8B0SJ37_9GAMM|nr:cytochrome c maturation protein CcmE [Thiothrix fructosivorans]MBO0615321.1 cytochrome c maturation protein CcmE [Thiothrix fructosivorans]QTX10098.1 cytochrome c maturation protein CcmE [Thiothrix fructosivorans]
MTPVRKKRLLLILALVAGVGVAATLVLQAFNQNMMFYYAPKEVKAGNAPANHDFRVGGLVVKGTVKRDPNNLDVHFDITDMTETVTVKYTGILPDLFREGQGIIARGRLLPSGVIEAAEVLAKHDENYMPPEVAASLPQKPASEAK